MTALRAARTPLDERQRLTAAVAADPVNPDLRRALGRLLARAGEPRPALEQYRAVLNLVPNDPDAAADAGLMARRCALEEEVLPLVRAAADANPRHPRLWQVLGLMHRSLDELDPATAALDRAAALAPKDPLIVHGRARAWMEGGKPAVGYFEQALRLAPTDQTILQGLMAALVAENRSDDAVALARAALRRYPEWIAVHETLAQHLWSVGEKEGFTASMEEALRTRPRDVLLWKALIIVLMQAKLFEQALAAIERGRAAAGDHLVFDANEAVCHSDTGDFAAADRLYASVPLDDPTIRLRYVGHLLKTGRPAQAEETALPMTRTPAAADFWPYLSIAWRMTGNPLWEWLEGDPRLVGTFDLAEALPSLEALAAFLRSLHLTTHQPLEQSVRGGTQTDGMLFMRTEPEVRSLRAAIVEAVREHIAQLPPVDPGHPLLARSRAPIRFTGSWSIRLTGGGRHANHVHPAGWFSSALYIALPDPAERGPEPAGWLTLGEPPAELGLDLPPFRTIEPQPGRLALFPSTMWHGTRPFAEGERLTVAFDVAPPL
ncbi:MAG TPA: tetratricopeptide repeat protein [Allosphingosinicella sp.]|nr:tetratricopeptide repeat protein [Allosphingosinicella sp.]